MGGERPQLPRSLREKRHCPHRPEPEPEVNQKEPESANPLGHEGDLIGCVATNWEGRRKLNRGQAAPSFPQEDTSSRSRSATPLRPRTRFARPAPAQPAQGPAHSARRCHRPLRIHAQGSGASGSAPHSAPKDTSPESAPRTPHIDCASPFSRFAEWYTLTPPTPRSRFAKWYTLIAPTALPSTGAPQAQPRSYADCNPGPVILLLLLAVPFSGCLPSLRWYTLFRKLPVHFNRNCQSPLASTQSHIRGVDRRPSFPRRLGHVDYCSYKLIVTPSVELHLQTGKRFS